MSETPTAPDIERQALANARRALRLAAANLPHLSGLAHTVRLQVTPSCSVAAIGPTGLLLVNPEVFANTRLPDLAFVMAHELMHLALDTFSRQGHDDPHLVNIAHDYVINDILREELNQPTPLDGLVRPGARHESLEVIVIELRTGAGSVGEQHCWGAGSGSGRRDSRGKGRTRPKPGKSAMQIALEAAGLIPPDAPEEPPEPAPVEQMPGDTLSAEEEAKREPDIPQARRDEMRQRVRREAVRSVSLREIAEQLRQGEQSSEHGGESGDLAAYVEAVTTAYEPPWQLALQRWLDAVGPSTRTYARASRRGGDRLDVVLPGRRREGWTLHVVLDTSGSMTDTLPLVLGLISSFCAAAGVSEVHIMQVDVAVMKDEWIDVTELGRYEVAGFGGSDMSAAMNRLSQDGDVDAVLVLTDGYIDYPAHEPPYNVLWGIVNGVANFSPSYGTVVQVRM